MAWVRLDDHFDENAKIVAVGPIGIALWAAGLAYCNRNLTDGFIPWGKAQALISWQFLGPSEFDGRQKVYKVAVTCGMSGDDVTSEYAINLLLTHGLWHDADGGYRVHDYEHYQPTRAQIEAERRAKSEAGRLGGLASTIARGQARGQARAVAETKPVPKPVPRSQDQVLGPGAHESSSELSCVSEKKITTPKTGDDYSAEFDAFWRAYPHRIDKRAAWKCWVTRLKEKVCPEQIIQAAHNFAAWHAASGTEPQFIPHPATWLGPTRRFEEWIQGPPEPPRAKRPASSMDNLKSYMARLREENNGQGPGGQGVERPDSGAGTSPAPAIDRRVDSGLRGSPHALLSGPGQGSGPPLD